MLRLAKIAALISAVIVLNVATTIVVVEVIRPNPASAQDRVEVTKFESLVVKRLVAEEALFIAPPREGEAGAKAVVIRPGQLFVTGDFRDGGRGSGPVVELMIGQGLVGEMASIVAMAQSDDGDAIQRARLSTDSLSSALVVETSRPKEEYLTGFQMFAAGRNALLHGGEGLLDVIHGPGKEEQEERVVKQAGAYSPAESGTPVYEAMKKFVDRNYAAYRDRLITSGADPATIDKKMEESMPLSARAQYEMQQATHFLIAEAKAHAVVANYDLSHVFMSTIFVNQPTETWDRLMQKAKKQLEEAKAEYETEYGMKWKG